jgi:hypothetical protein
MLQLNAQSLHEFLLCLGNLSFLADQTEQPQNGKTAISSATIFNLRRQDLNCVFLVVRYRTLTRDSGIRLKRDVASTNAA